MPTIIPNQSATDLSVADVVISAELRRRKALTATFADEAEAMRQIADTMATDPSRTFNVCAEVVLRLCQADSCGISVQERGETGEEVFRWIAMAGQLEHLLEGTMPRFFSPCGLCVDTGTPLLMCRPERVYKYLDVGLRLHDVLLVPLAEMGSDLRGTICVVAHDPERKFGSEDAHAMQRMAVFISTSLHLTSLAEAAKAEAAEQRLLLRELDHRVKNTFAMTASLLRYQLSRVTNPAARSAIEAAAGRVVAAGHMHDIGSRASGDLREVIENVANHLIGADPRFTAHFDVESVVMPSHKAAVVALITNELVTNSIKHGFNGRDVGNVKIGLHRTPDDSVTLSVTDDGEPMPSDRPKAKPGIGLGLVERLASQLGGSLMVMADDKAFEVRFPT